ncbi:MAG: ABC transporter substrate-binding protein, partial [Thermoanaerobaculia bacterium]
MRRLRVFLILASALALISSAPANAAVFRWGGDAEGGAPFVEADPNDPSKLRGFDVEVAEQIAKGLGKTPEFVQVQFTDIDQSVQRGDFEIGMSGVEDTPARRRMLAATIPYFEFHEVLTMRSEDRGKFSTLAALRGRRVGTLGGTIAYERLLAAEKTDGVVCVSYDDDVHPYADLRAGRLDAVLLDNIIAARSMRRIPGLYTEARPVATAHYIGVLATGNTTLRDRINDILRARMRDGTLERIYRKWGIWDAYQPAFFASVLNADAGAKKAAEGHAPAQNLDIVLRYIPALLRASLITIVLSCAAMALAV